MPMYRSRLSDVSSTSCGAAHTTRFKYCPGVLFRTDPYNENANSRPFDVSNNGKRFVFAKRSGETRPTCNVVTNWLQEVVARVNAQQKPAR